MTGNAQDSEVAAQQIGAKVKVNVPHHHQLVSLFTHHHKPHHHNRTQTSLIEITMTMMKQQVLVENFMKQHHQQEVLKCLVLLQIISPMFLNMLTMREKFQHQSKKETGLSILLKSTILNIQTGLWILMKSTILIITMTHSIAHSLSKIEICGEMIHFIMIHNGHSIMSTIYKTILIKRLINKEEMTIMAEEITTEEETKMVEGITMVTIMETILVIALALVPAPAPVIALVIVIVILMIEMVMAMVEEMDIGMVTEMDMAIAMTMVMEMMTIIVTEIIEDITIIIKKMIRMKKIDTGVKVKTMINLLMIILI